MSNSVASRSGGANGKAGAGSGLYTARGARKYLTRSERQRAMAAMARDETDAGLMALTLAWTGARVSEVLALTPEAFQVEAGLVAIVTLKRRRPTVREVPIPRELIDALDRRFGLAAAQRSGEGLSRPLMAVLPGDRLASDQGADGRNRDLRPPGLPARPAACLRHRHPAGWRPPDQSKITMAGLLESVE